ncbi:MAG: Rne/Rng family ribonuclease [Deltaproteobacteria bacterium]|nr:Rne/Rng family ribonuclease [Deltaproteobacteria bacterium]
MSRKPEKKLIINAEASEECRIALVEDGKLEAFHIETIGHEVTRGNIYKSKVVSIEPSLQAAFIDYGGEKNGFLSLSEIHPEYYGVETAAEKGERLRIQDLIEKGQELLVQVVKEAAGQKGAALTTYLSLPGRYLVLLPGSSSAGVSRKIEDEEQRKKLKEIMKDFELPEGIGFIVRTASLETTKRELSKDLQYLLRLWKDIKDKGQTLPAPALIYKEEYLIIRSLRDYFSSDTCEILVDDKESFDRIRDFMRIISPRHYPLVKLYKDPGPIFSRYNLEAQIEKIYESRVNLPSGGSIVINPTEALVAIDVNSSRAVREKEPEETAFKTNMEAAEEIARQLRLRDLAGLIVIDFIDMRQAAHQRAVEKRLRDSLKKDKAKIEIGKISKFGLLELTRQKLRSPISMGSYKTCSHCQGRGIVRSVEAQAIAVLRRIQAGLSRGDVSGVQVRIPVDVATYLLNRKRGELFHLETRRGLGIHIDGQTDLLPGEAHIEFSKTPT